MCYIVASLPGLCTPKDVGARVLLEAREAEKMKETMHAAGTNLSYLIAINHYSILKLLYFLFKM